MRAQTHLLKHALQYPPHHPPTHTPWDLIHSHETEWFKSVSPFSLFRTLRACMPNGVDSHLAYTYYIYLKHIRRCKARHVCFKQHDLQPKWPSRLFGDVVQIDRYESFSPLSSAQRKGNTSRMSRSCLAKTKRMTLILFSDKIVTLYHKTLRHLITILALKEIFILVILHRAPNKHVGLVILKEE